LTTDARMGRLKSLKRRGHGLCGRTAKVTAMRVSRAWLCFAPDIVVFLDGDYSDYPSEMSLLVHPILAGEAEMVIGSRIRGVREKGALLPQARFGNALATLLIKRLFRVSYTDLGPFRAIRYDRLLEMDMQDKTFGWTVEMQVKAAKMGIRACEVPVSYRKRIGQSKITGTVKGTIKAGYKILMTIFRYGLIAS